MKQVIVLISSIALGVAIATLILGFETDAASMANVVSNQIETFCEGFQ